MNVALNNQLVEAVKILREAEQKYAPQINKYKKDVEEADKKIKDYQQAAWFIKKPTVPKKIEKKTKDEYDIVITFCMASGYPLCNLFFINEEK